MENSSNHVQNSLSVPEKQFIVSQHEIKPSLDSIYSGGPIDSNSVSHSQSSSVDSVQVQQISNKTKAIAEMVTSRLTAFLYMSNLALQDENSHSKAEEELEVLRRSLSETLNVCKESDDQVNEIYVKSVLEQIMTLQKEFSFLQNKLMETRAEVKETEEEEIELKGKMHQIEKDVTKFIIETKESVHSTCHCDLF